MPEITDPPPELAGSQHCWLPRSRKSPRLARRLLRELLARVEGGERFLDIGELLLSELVTNAVLHSPIPGRLVFPSLEVDAALLRIEVHDASGDRLPEPRTATEDHESGRGLTLVKSLSRRWGCYPREGGIGKTTWLEYVPELNR